MALKRKKQRKREKLTELLKTKHEIRLSSSSKYGTIEEKDGKTKGKHGNWERIHRTNTCEYIHIAHHSHALSC